LESVIEAPKILRQAGRVSQLEKRLVVVWPVTLCTHCGILKGLKSDFAGNRASLSATVADRVATASKFPSLAVLSRNYSKLKGGHRLAVLWE
jgi:hypothetical protein